MPKLGVERRVTMPAREIDTTPFWTAAATFPQLAKLARDLVTDVAVVGVTGKIMAGPAEAPLSQVE
jgi:hypothetical protein